MNPLTSSEKGTYRSRNHRRACRHRGRREPVELEELMDAVRKANLRHPPE